MASPADPVEDARKRLRDTAQAFLAVADRAIAIAADRKSRPMEVSDARTQGTFALAAVGAAFKAALKAARPSTED